MSKFLMRLSLSVLLVSWFPALNAQTTPSAADLSTAAPALRSGAVIAANQQHASTTLAPFSRFAIGGGISSAGVNMQAAMNVTSHLNLRATGNFFNYEDKNISTNGFTVDGKLNFATAGIALDYYPFAHHGLRISPGVLVNNQNAVSATLVAQGGTSFTLNNVTYYSSPSQPVAGNGSLGLHTQNPAPMLTLGWGNMIPRNGGHWSFPVEVGAAYIGQPALNIALTSGQVCANPQGTVNCQNVAGNASVNQNLQAQITKYNSDLEPLRFYPIVSFGASYSFHIRKAY